MRDRLHAQLGAASALPERLVPQQPGEDEARQRANILIAAMTSRLAAPPPALLAGSGPFGLLTPADAGALLQQAQTYLEGTAPKLASLARAPGARDLANSLSASLAKRFAARAIKFAFGGQEAATMAFMPGASPASAGPAQPKF